MSPDTQVALITLILFFAIATVSNLWPRLTQEKRSSLKRAGDTQGRSGKRRRAK